MTSEINFSDFLPAVVNAQQRAEAGQYLTFLLGRETYALGILNIKEIIDYDHLTDVPMMPSFVRGVINLRGSVVPVIDLQARFGKGETLIAKRTAIVIIEAANDNGWQYIGIIVDAVNEVMDIAQQDIEPAPDFGVDIHLDFINGMAKRGDGFVILLNVHRVLTADEMAGINRAGDFESA